MLFIIAFEDIFNIIHTIMIMMIIFLYITII